MSTGNPYEPSHLPPMGSGPNPGLAAQKVTGPAIALIVVGALNILGSLYWAFQGVVVSVMPAEQIQAQMEAQNPQFQQQPMPFDMTTFLRSYGVGLIVVAVLALIFSVVIILGGIKMKNLQSRGLAVTASVLAMIPCLSPCCIVGLPIGIWSLVVLNDTDVKSSYMS
jgi:hypothetical protein